MSESDDSDPRKYIRTADAIRQRIDDGTYRPGLPLPSITVISKQTRYARATVSKALRMLAGEGLVVRYPGLGYHVRPRPVTAADEAGVS